MNKLFRLLLAALLACGLTLSTAACSSRAPYSSNAEEDAASPLITSSPGSPTHHAE